LKEDLECAEKMYFNSDLFSGLIRV